MTTARAEAPERGRQGTLRKLAGRPSGVFGLVVVVILLVFALLPHGWLPHDPLTGDPNLRFLPPVGMARGTWSHPLGTEALGGDILSMLIAGTRYTLIIVLGAGVVSMVLGVLLGLLAGFVGRWLDTVVMRLVDIQLAFPALVLIIAVVAAFGPSLLNLVLILGVVGWAPYARLVRGSVLSLRERGFVQSAVATGIGTTRILLRHLLPNAVTSIIVYFTAELATLVLLEASLSFLGLGIQPPNPSWGGMIATSRQYMTEAWWASVFPGILIIVTVLGITFLGDELRDVLDPTAILPVRRRRAALRQAVASSAVRDTVTGAAGALLQVDDLHVEFPGPAGTVVGVKSVSLQVNPGEILAVVGESGSGKSVTTMAIAGLLPRNSVRTGSITLAGEQVLTARPSQLRRLRSQVVSVVFQNPIAALNPVFPIGFQIIEAVRTHDASVSRRKAHERAVGLLRAVGMPAPEQRMHFYPHQLSGGQCQRVVIAIALASDPALLIADEPTTALDVTIQAEVLALLRSIRDTLNMAILLITHDMGVVADMADRVLVMRQGEVVEQAPIDDLFARPTADYTRRLLEAVPRMEPRAATPAAALGTAKSVVSIEDACVHFHRRGMAPVAALAGVSLDVRAGEMVGIVGESGSGKSTTGRVVLGLTQLTSGRVTVLGARIDRHRHLRAGDLREVRRRIGVVFQSPLDSLDPRRSVFDSIAEPLYVHAGLRGAALRTEVRQLLEAVHLPGDWGSRWPRELSGGQLQRVSIARAMALKPDLLIADEPTSALDVSVQAQVLATFAELHERHGFACLFISHNLAVVSQLCERIVVMRAGKVVEDASRETVLTSATDPYTRELIEAAPVPDPTAQRARRRVRQLDVAGVVAVATPDPLTVPEEGTRE